MANEQFDYIQKVKSLTEYMLGKGMNIKPLPKVKFIDDDTENADNFFGKTAYYSPDQQLIVLYTMNRHPKDVMRSFAHEMIHHMQNCEGRLDDIQTQNTNEDGALPEIEREAYEKGNMTFRNWEDNLKNKPADILKEDISKDELKTIEMVADNWFKKYNIDIEFTKHFYDRVNDARNGKPISSAELLGLFKKTKDKYGKKLSKSEDDFEAVLKNIQNDLNLPFALTYNSKNDELELIAKTIMRKKDFSTSNPVLTLEGKYDKDSNEISSKIFDKWKSDFLKGKTFSKSVFDYESNNIIVEIDAQIKFIPNSNELVVDGGADPETDYIEVRFEVDPLMLPKSWEEISMNIKDVIRHEIEHLTHSEGSNTKGNKLISDDLFMRKLINSKLLPLSAYFKLEKEIDANLQGMYFRAKKEKKPLADIINNYLNAQNITPEEKKEILNLWRTRIKALSLPKF
jgi:hypothetical protein